MTDDEEAFAAFERGMTQMRSVLEVEHERIDKGHLPDEALLKRGAEIEDDTTRRLAQEADALNSARPPAVILDFPLAQKPGDA